MKKLVLIYSLLTLSFFSIAQQKQFGDVHFDFDKYEMRDIDTMKLTRFLDQFGRKKIAAIELHGHTDSKGSNAYNDALSLQRANTVKDFLEKNLSIDPSIITLKAFGERDLLNKDISDEQSHQNRRVDILLTITKTVTEPVKTETTIETAKETKSLTAAIEDTATKIGTTITLQNLNFENNSDVLIPTSIPTLEELLQVMIKNTTMRILIEGHICCVVKVEGRHFTEWPNFEISLLRAKMVYDYLGRNGIDAGRMGYTAFGSSQPIYPIPEKTEGERIANRRVEVRILEK